MNIKKKTYFYYYYYYCFLSIIIIITIATFKKQGQGRGPPFPLPVAKVLRTTRIIEGAKSLVLIINTQYGNLTNIDLRELKRVALLNCFAISPLP